MARPSRETLSGRVNDSNTASIFSLRLPDEMQANVLDMAASRRRFSCEASRMPSWHQIFSKRESTTAYWKEFVAKRSAPRLGERTFRAAFAVRARRRLHANRKLRLTLIHSCAVAEASTTE